MFIVLKIKKYWLIFPKSFRYFIKYSIVGVSNACIDFFTYWALTRSFLYFETHFLIANAIAFILATGWGFIWNRNWTFEKKDGKKLNQYIKYIIISLGGLFIIEVILLSLVKFGMHDMIAKIIAGIFAWAWNFTLNKIWTFKEKLSS